MVRAAQFNSLGFAEFLLRIRPGVAISIALHIALILFLAYILAFPPGDPPIPEPDQTAIEIIPLPVEPLRPTATPIQTIKIEPTREIKDVHIDVPPLPVAAVRQTSEKNSPPVIAETQSPASVPTPVIINPAPISRGGLFYPEKALERNVSGYVDFSFIIEPDGSVGDPQVIGEVPLGYGFAAAARRAFTQWKFEPKRINGVAVAALAQIRISFRLQ